MYSLMTFFAYNINIHVSPLQQDIVRWYCIEYYGGFYPPQSGEVC